MKVEDFVRQLNGYSRKVDADFILNNKIEDVITYLNEAEIKRNLAIENRDAIIAQNKEETDALLTYLLDVVKIDQWKIFKSRKRGKGWLATTVRGDMYAHYKKVFEDVKSYVPMLPPKVDDFGQGNCDYELIYNNTTLRLRFHKEHTIQDIFEKSVTAIKDYENQIAKDNKHLTLAKEFLDKRGEDYSELVTAKDIIGLAEEMSKEEYREMLFSDGETIEVQHSDGEDCEWDGGHRCVCGNNRYYLEVDGDMVNGYYSYGQWCQENIK